MTNRTGASSDALLDRMAAAAKDCRDSIPYADECLDDEAEAKIASLDAVLAEYDRLRSEPSDALLDAAFHVLRSYQYGNCATEPAKELADKIEAYRLRAQSLAAAPSAGSAVGGDDLLRKVRGIADAVRWWTKENGDPRVFNSTRRIVELIDDFIGHDMNDVMQDFGPSMQELACGESRLGYKQFTKPTPSPDKSQNTLTASPEVAAAPVALDKCMHGWPGCTDHGAHEHFAGPSFDQPQASGVAVFRPMDSAPKDGTIILLVRDDETVTAGNWMEESEILAAEFHNSGEYLGQFPTGDVNDACWMSWDGGFTEDRPPIAWAPMPVWHTCEESSECAVCDAGTAVVSPDRQQASGVAATGEPPKGTEAKDAPAWQKRGGASLWLDPLTAADGARYRWIRDECTRNDNLEGLLLSPNPDEAIDAVRLAPKKCLCGATTVDPWCPRCRAKFEGPTPTTPEAKAESGPVAPTIFKGNEIDHAAQRGGYAAPTAPERAEGQRVTELLSRSVEMLRSYSAAINDKDSDLCARLGRYHYVPSIDMLVGDIEAALGAVVREGETKPATDNVAGAYPAHQCQICGWPLAASWEEGCVPRNCSYRPQEGSSEFTRIRLRRDALAAAQETKPFDTTSPCGDPDVAVMARDAATGEPTMFSRKHTDG